jgi:beta-N-acetylhexosaminidase
VLRAAAILCLVAALATGATGPSPTVSQMAGQLVFVRMHGQTATAAFLDRIRRGEIGGVALFADNVGPHGLKPLAMQLQAAATAGGRPPLLIAIDQEGGSVKRLAGAPTLAPSEMRSPAVAEAQGLATARNLRTAAVNVDFAPVLDVGHGGFIAPRTFGSTPATVAARGAAFAAGLAHGSVLATAKHFPGLGYARLNTDDTPSTVTASLAQLRADWLPYTRAIAGGIPLVMLSTAVYPALGSKLPAALSRVVVADLRQLGFQGAIVTDALDSPAVGRFMTTDQAAVRAIVAGGDLDLFAGLKSEDTSSSAFAALVAAERSGSLPLSRLRAAYEQVMALKRSLG